VYDSIVFVSKELWGWVTIVEYQVLPGNVILKGRVLCVIENFL
jgi:hypothetical protein